MKNSKKVLTYAVIVAIATVCALNYELFVFPNKFAPSGLTAFSTAVCFALALFFSPVFLAIPGAATAPALVIVGVMMMPSVKRIHWDDYCKSIPAFLTIILMPVAYSISDGILIGVIAYVITHAIAGRFKEISIPMWVLAVLFILRYIFI